jgi:enolase
MEKVCIKKIKARMIIDSRGNPTVEVALLTDFDDFWYIASVPSGASRGEHEAWEIRDRGVEYRGLGVNRVINNINEFIAPSLEGESVLDQAKIDNALVEIDGHKNKSRLGANASLPVSLAVCRAAARAKNKFLWQHIGEIYGDHSKKNGCFPRPSFNVINGGMHAGNHLSIQEFMVIPQNNNYSDNLRMGVEVYGELKKILIDQIGPASINVGDEGGFAPDLIEAESALDLIMAAAENIDFGGKIKIGLDCAASSFFKQDQYYLGGKVKSRDSLIDYYRELVNNYPIIFLEDPLEEEDWLGWGEMVTELGDKVAIIGDDLLATNVARINEAEKMGSANGLVVKPNQVGTVTEALEAAALASSLGWQIMVSHRSGDTNDSFIADLAVAIGADYFKSGAPVRGERVAKYNRLLEIQEEQDE